MKKSLISDYDGTFFIDDENIKYNIEKVREFRNKRNIFVCKCLESRTSINQENITKIHIKCNNQAEQLKFNNILNNKYKKFVKSYLITGLNNCIEIISSSTDKSAAIKEIAKIENIEENKIFTVGDSFNDLEMLEAFNGVCMKNSEELVKSKITKTCISVAEVIDKVIGGTNE